jgi:CheY-like chemotaxis protein
MLPDMDGWQVYHTLRADQAIQHIPVIVITPSRRESIWCSACM